MKYSVKGLDRLFTQLADLSNSSLFIEECVKAIDKGSDIVADTTRSELQNLRVDDRRFVEGQRDSIRSVEKVGLLNSFGITPVQYKDRKNSIDRKTGVDDERNKLDVKNVTVARRLENGTSWMKKNPVFTKASRKARKQCLIAMEISLNDSIQRIWNSR